MPLEGYRALDLTDEKGFPCRKILGNLGMDVIKAERPGGDSSRNIGPFAKYKSVIVCMAMTGYMNLVGNPG
ncbi:MAG: CoA transferase [Dehalococcoidia bacterium]|nr:CoA transferase [Dehalococcoidia bacterium]